jgi:hypothetical protein
MTDSFAAAALWYADRSPSTAGLSDEQIHSMLLHGKKNQTAEDAVLTQDVDRVSGMLRARLPDTGHQQASRQEGHQQEGYQQERWQEGDQQEQWQEGYQQEGYQQEGYQQEGGYQQ